VYPEGRYCDFPRKSPHHSINPINRRVRGQAFFYSEKINMRDTLQQLVAAIYTAILEALGNDDALHRADRVLREMLEDIDSSIDDPLAQEVLRDMLDGADHARVCQHQERLAIEWERDRRPERALEAPVRRLVEAPRFDGLFMDDLAIAGRH
jgi:hypothetical protein